MRKKKQVILLERVKKLGETGDFVSVALGFAGNYLIPQGKALPATKAAKETFEKEKAQRVKESKEKIKKAEALAKSIDGKKISVERQATNTGRLYGSINVREIWSLLQEDKSLQFIERSYLSLLQPIKEVGTFPLKVEVYPDVVAILHIEVSSAEKIPPPKEGNEKLKSGDVLKTVELPVREKTKDQEAEPEKTEGVKDSNSS